MKKFSVYMEYLAATILFFAVMVVLLIGYTHLKKEDSPQKIIIEFKKINPKDSISLINAISDDKLEDVLVQVKNFNHDIQQHQFNLVKDQEDKDYFNKFYSIIVAVILVIAGFFGYKNINEIKDKAVDEATSASKKIAEEKAIEASAQEFNKIFTDQYKGEIHSQTIAAFSETVFKENETLNALILKLTERIEILEVGKTISEVQNTEENDVSDESAEELRNPFTNE